MRIHCIQHVPFEAPGRILDWAQARGHAVSTSPLYAGAAIPPPDAYDWLIVMGGPMGVHDEAAHPWLRDEKRALEQALAAGTTILGICLGAQLLAHVLGARVYANGVREIGWFPIHRVVGPITGDAFDGFPDSLEVFHWHGDTFDIPRGATHVFRSEACARQAFVYGDNAYALQFHLECTVEGVRALSEHGRAELQPAPFVQHVAASLVADPRRFMATHAVLDAFLTRLEEKRHVRHS